METAAGLSQRMEIKQWKTVSTERYGQRQFPFNRNKIQVHETWN